MDSNNSQKKEDCDNISNSDCYIIEVKEDVVSLSSESSDIVFIKEDSKKKITEMDNSFTISSDSECSVNVVDDISINVQSEASDGNVSDINTGVIVKWNKVGSPKGWTKAMKRYYNKPCKRQRYFDWRKVLEEIRLASRSLWEIQDKDKYPIRVKPRRCIICRKTDHLSYKCPRRNGICSMCGDQGHTSFRCPRTMCLNCGAYSIVFTDCCTYCKSEKYMKCTACEKKGHDSNNCPDLWRRFHRTVEFEEINETPSPSNSNIQCCNCAKAGHYFEECPEGYWTTFTSSSAFVVNYKDFKQKNNDSSYSPNVEILRTQRYDLDGNILAKRMKFYEDGQQSSMKQKFFMALRGDPLRIFQRKKKRNKRKKKKKTSPMRSNQNADAQKEK